VQAAEPHAVSGNGQAGVKPPRKRRVEDSRFPYRMDFGITVEMNAAVRRMMRGPFKASQVGQLILHDYFMRSDPLYAAAMNEESHHGTR